MKSGEHSGWLRSPGPEASAPLSLLIAATLAAFLAIAWHQQPVDLPEVYFLKQDVPVLCVMLAGVLIFPRVRFSKRWETEITLSARSSFFGAFLLFTIALAGHWMVMQGYDLSRDEAMATLAARQIAEAAVVTPVPVEWQPYGRAMLPIFFNGRISPDIAWASAYLPVNAAFQALAATIAHPAIANPLLLVVGLFALWKASRRIWPERRDVAVVTVLLAATSQQAITAAMTSYAMTGHFALNMVWLALFLRGDRAGMVGALFIGFLATGLHQIHFHLMFVAPFLAWLIIQRRSTTALLYGLGYAAITLIWFKAYPAWVIEQAGPDALTARHGPSLWHYIMGRLARLFDYSPAVWLQSLVRFVAWQNFILIPLLVAAWPVFRERLRTEYCLLPLAMTCALGLVLMVYQGHGWGYRYLSGLIGCFCLIAGYGWIRLVPEPGSARAWAMVKYGCIGTVLVLLPAQLAMARSFVAPYATLHQAAVDADVDAVLVDIESGFFAQDIVQNAPDFEQRPVIMDLSLLSPVALAKLCTTKRVARIDRWHYRATGMREAPIAPDTRRSLDERRAMLERLKCAPSLPLSK